MKSLTRRIWQKAVGIGEFSAREANIPQEGQVFGITSSGVFIKLDSGGMLFLSENRRRGPISIHIPAGWLGHTSLQIHDPVHVAKGDIEILRTGQVIQTAHLESWRPLLAALEKRTDPSGQRERLVGLAASLLAVKPERGLSGLLSYLTGGSESGDIPTETRRLSIQADRLRRFLVEKDVSGLVDAASAFLGYGSGLTPSGDDFVLGILLHLNRWFALDWEGERLNHLNQELVRAAYQKTTTLSACLIECATLGSADEFLVAASDYLAASTGVEQACLEGLLSWGSSSGVDTLAGMALVITANSINLSKEI